MIGKPKHLKVRKGQTARAAAEHIANYAREEQAHGVIREGQPGYYAKADTPSRWIGEGAKALGLEGAVRRDDLIEVLQGRLPGGTDLSKRGGREADRRMGTDLTISAPKSFSILAIAGSDQRLAGLWDEAVNEAAKVIEREVIVARRGHGGSEVEQTGSMVCAAYTHQDARTVDGFADPDLHTHLLLMNATQRADGEWVARDLAFGERNVLRMTADFAMKAHLAKRLQELGYRVRVTKDGFEIEGITQEQIDAFSRRTGQVDTSLESQGLTREASSANQRDVATLGTREGKTKLSRIEHTYEVRDRVRTGGLDLDALTREARVRGSIETTDLTTEAIKSAARHLGERESVFSKNQTRLEALRAGMGGTTLEQIDASIQVPAQTGLLDFGDNKLTTRDAMYREQEILARARAGHGQAAALMSGADAESFIKDREASQGFRYSNGQRAALALSLTSPDRVIGVVGAAGAGKTTSIAGTVEAAKANGHEVVGIAPSAAASHELKSAGADDTRTLASLLASKQTEGQSRVYILDEAGMVSGRDMDALLQRIDKEGARLLLVGDPRQLSAVEAGSPFAQMLETGAIQHATIDEIQRQHDPQLREIAQAFARGEAAQGAALARPYMHEVAIPKREEAEDEKPTTQEKRAAIAAATAADYLKRDTDTRGRTLVVTGTNDLRQQINSQIREGLREQGAVSRDAAVTVMALDKAGLTREQQARAESYRPGMVIRLEEGRGQSRRTIEYKVQGVNGNTVTVMNPEGESRDWNPIQKRPMGVYQPRDMELSPGDKVVFRENQAGVDRIRNGEAATIDRIEDGKPIARLDSGKEITLDPARGQTVDYGWCRTIHSSQGATVDHVIVAGEASRMATAQTAYVAASRERETLTVYTDHGPTLEKTWAKTAEREYAAVAAKTSHALDIESLETLRAEAARDLGHHGDLARARENEPLELKQARQERDMEIER